MSYEIRAVESAGELAEAFDVMGAQFQPARTHAHRSFAELARLFPERRTLMLLAEDQGRIVGGAYIGPRATLAIGLEPGARGQGTGRRLLTALEQEATRLGMRAINVSGVTERTRGFYARLGYQRQGSLMIKGLSQSAVHRNPAGWRRDLAGLRARRAARASGLA